MSQPPDRARPWEAREARLRGLRTGAAVQPVQVGLAHQDVGAQADPRSQWLPQG